jgi:superfamily I DNA/RNA helicase
MEQLNKKQKEAVTASPNGILQILAGPGSGKTKVLTHRVGFLLERGMKPENIILTTFTNVDSQCAPLMLESGWRNERAYWKVGCRWH